MPTAPSPLWDNRTAGLGSARRAATPDRMSLQSRIDETAGPDADEHA
ncbi:MAG: hypothetical protein QNJ44_17575 [Rhodobacter sp.]|nr:hypothetical protein [Rhodobacter sp.]